MPIMKCSKCEGLVYVKLNLNITKCPLCDGYKGLERAVWGKDYGYNENGERFGEVKEVIK